MSHCCQGKSSLSIRGEVYLRLNKERVLVEGMAVSLPASFSIRGLTQHVDRRLSLHSDEKNFTSFTRIVDRAVIGESFVCQDYFQNLLPGQRQGE